jgi:hypothetical protein
MTVYGGRRWWFGGELVVVCGGWGVCEQCKVYGVKKKCEVQVKVMGKEGGK